MESFVKSLREFLHVTNLDKEKIHLIGCSYGGAVAGLFAHDYPEIIENLVLLCPAMKTPIPTNATKKLMDGDYSCLIPNSGSDLKNIALLVSNKSHSYPFFPKTIMNTFFDLHYPIEKRQLIQNRTIIFLKYI